MNVSSKMANDLDALEDCAGVLISKLEPAARNKLARSLKDRAEANAPKVRYEQREVLGFTAADLEVIREGLLVHLKP